MKIVFRIFGIIAILMALLTCAMSVYRANLDKEDVADAYANATKQLAQFREQANQVTGETKAYLDTQIDAAEKQINEVGSPTTYVILEVLLSALLLLALVFGVFLFRPNPKLALPLLGAAVVLLLAAYFVSPDIQRGPYSGANSRTLALLSGIPVIVAGLCAFGIARKSQP